jgi:hypothetical protein
MKLGILMCFGGLAINPFPLKAIDDDGGPTGTTAVAKPIDFKKKKCEDFNLSREDILKYIKDNYKKILKSKNDLPPILILNYAKTINNYSKLIDIEKETMIKRKWFITISKIFHDIYICRSAVETAQMNKDKKAFDAAKVNYYKLLSQLKKVYENPPLIKDKKGKK